MAYPHAHAVAFTTTAGGAATVFTSETVTGRLIEVRYTYDDADTGADFTITGETSGKALLTITNAGTSSISWQPRQVVHPVANTGAGTALTFDGTNEIYEAMPLVNERIKTVVASGGNAKSGTLTFLVE